MATVKKLQGTDQTLIRDKTKEGGRGSELESSSRRTFSFCTRLEFYTSRQCQRHTTFVASTQIIRLAKIFDLSTRQHTWCESQEASKIKGKLLKYFK